MWELKSRPSFINHRINKQLQINELNKLRNKILLHIFDRAYNKFSQLFSIHQKKCTSSFGQRKTCNTELSNGNVDYLKMNSQTVLSSLQSTRKQRTILNYCDWCISLMRSKNVSSFFLRM